MTDIVVTSHTNLPFPHKCIVCGSDLVDCYNFVGITQMWNGALLICKLCVNAMVKQFADEFDLTSAAALTETQVALELSTQREQKFDAALSEYKELLDAARNRFDQLLSADSSPAPNADVPAESGPVEIVKSTDEFDI